jgi:hypothetical protein
MVFSGIVVCGLALGNIQAAEPESRGARPPVSGEWPRHTLQASSTWQLNLPGGRRFDASGLLLKPSGELLTVNDKEPGLFRVEFPKDGNSANLVPESDCFSAKQLEKFRGEKIGPYDCEGLAMDDQGRIYLCEESSRWVLRCDPGTKTVQRLAIDWTPVKKYFSPLDSNASFEGIAFGAGRLYVANERQMGRILVVDPGTLRVIDDFAVRPLGSTARDTHYSDLCWFDGSLYVLLRESRCVLRVPGPGHQVTAEYSFREMERDREVIYNSAYPTGCMEGLAVDLDHFWLVTDNNGAGRVKYPRDTRPTLFRCDRPDR